MARPTKKMKELAGRVDVLQQLRELDADKHKKEVKELKDKLSSIEMRRQEVQANALEALAHLAEAVSKTVMSMNRDL